MDMTDPAKLKVGDTISWKTQYGLHEIGTIESLPGAAMTRTTGLNNVMGLASVRLMRGPVINLELGKLQGLGLLDAIALASRELGDNLELT